MLQTMDDKEKRTHLKDEYLHIQKMIVDLDGRALTIKAWSVSFSLASAGGAFAVHAPVVLLLSAVSAVIFWVIEARWKHFQYGFYGRSEVIERFFQGKAPETVPMQIDHHWNNIVRISAKPGLIRTMLKAHVALPHIVISLLTVLLYILTKVQVLAM